ncbi:MAG: HAD family hydrolase [Fidelibacterota bacterium]
MAVSKYRHIIWDWNGTLLNDAWLCVDVMNGVLARRGMPSLTPERYQEVFGFPVVDYYRRVGFDFDRESFEVSGTEFIVEYERRRHEARLQPGTKETLKAVSELGISQSLLSAYQQKTLDELTDYLGVRRYFVKVIGLDNHYARGKIENGKRWMREMRYGPHEVLLVGDTVHDHEVAEALGADCVLIPSGHHTRERLETRGVSVFNTVGDVLAVLT